MQKCYLFRVQVSEAKMFSNYMTTLAHAKLLSCIQKFPWAGIFCCIPDFYSGIRSFSCALLYIDIFFLKKNKKNPSFVDFFFHFVL